MAFFFKIAITLTNELFFYRIVAQAIAKFHHMDVPSNDLSKEPRIFSDFKTALEDFPEDYGTGRYKYSE